MTGTLEAAFFFAPPPSYQAGSEGGSSQLPMTYRRSGWPMTQQGCLASAQMIRGNC